MTLPFLFEIWLIVTLLLTAGYVSIIGTMIFGWIRLKGGIPSGGGLTVTVVIPARNEEKDIRQCLERLKNQSYPREKIEIIVADDYSEDKTAEIALEMGVSVIDVSKLKGSHPQKANKKRGIEASIKESSGEIILATDADSLPGRFWIETMVDGLNSESAVMVSGPVTYFKTDGIFKAFQDLEFASLVGIGGALTGLGTPFICNGANLGYRKGAFNKVGGYGKDIDIASGDDVLLMQKFARKKVGKIIFLKDPKAIVETRAPENFKEFVSQRVRWASKSFKYSFRFLIPLIFAYFFYISLTINLALIVFFPGFIGTLLLPFALKTAVDFIFLSLVVSFFRKCKLIYWIIPSEIFHLIYILGLGLISLKPGFKWKGRKAVH